MVFEEYMNRIIGHSTGYNVFTPSDHPKNACTDQVYDKINDCLPLKGERY